MSDLQVKRLREERGAAVRQMHEIVERAKRERRDLTPDESQRIDRLQAESNSKRQQYEQIEQVDAEVREVNAPKEVHRYPGGRGPVQRHEQAGPILKRNDSAKDYFADKYGARGSNPGIAKRLHEAIQKGQSEVRINTTSGSTGLIDTLMLGGFIDALRERSVVFQAGTMYRSLPAGHTSYKLPRLSSDLSAAWRAEEASITQSTSTVDQVNLDPKSLSALLKVSREAWQDLDGLNSIINTSAAGAFARELDRAVIGVTTSAVAPAGVLMSTGVNSTAVSDRLANGDIEDAILRMANSNVMIDDVAFIGSNRDHQHLLTQYSSNFGNVENSPYMDRANFESFGTSAVSLSTGGTASGIVGRWSDCLVGALEELTVQILTERYADTGQYGLVFHARMDVALLHDESFEILTGLST